MIDSSVKHHYPSQPPASPPIQSSTAADIGAGQVETADVASPVQQVSSQAATLQADQAELTTATSSHQAAANLVHFADQQLGNHPPQQPMQMVEIEGEGSTYENVATPCPSYSESALDVLNYVQEAEAQNIQTLLDAVQKSLDNARKLNEENMKHFYTKVQPKAMALKKQSAEVEAMKQAMDQKRLQEFQNKLSDLANDLRTELQTGNPATTKDLEAAYKQLQTLQAKTSLL